MISGIVVLDKPVGRSSSFLSRLCGRLLKAKKSGHLGTLDPFASGVLPVAVGAATKLIPFIRLDKKIYEFEVVFGSKSNSGDVTGNIIETTKNIPKASEIIPILPHFVGEIRQTPNAFSAVKIDGQRAYKLARKGIPVAIKERRVTIFDLLLLEQTDEISFRLKATVSPGTYIRSLAEDIASVLGSLAFVKALRRTVDGQFSEGDAVTLDQLAEMLYHRRDVLLPVEDVLVDIPVVFISVSDSFELENGRSVPLRSSSLTCLGPVLIRTLCGFMAIGEIREETVFPKRLICQSKRRF